jgi:hypothetical protein
MVREGGRHGSESSSLFQHGLQLRGIFSTASDFGHLKVCDNSYRLELFQDSTRQLAFIELPPDIWDNADDDGYVQAVIDLPGLPECRTRVSVTEAIQALHILKWQSQSNIPDLLLGLEHARYIVRHYELPDDLLQYLFEMADRFGCGDYLCEFMPERNAFENEIAGHETKLAGAYDREVTTLDAHMTSRGGMDENAIRETAETCHLTETQTQDLIESLIPGACQNGQFEALANLPDEAQILKMSESGNAHRVTIALPLLVDRGHFKWAAALLWSLNTMPGWINTECILEASTRMMRSDAQNADRQNFLSALLHHLWHQSTSYWSRLHDHNTARSILVWLNSSNPILMRTRQEIIECILGTLTLSQHFWTCWDADTIDLGSDLRIERALGAFRTIEALTLAPMTRASVSDAIKAAAVLRRFGNVDADRIMRELILYALSEFQNDTTLLDSEWTESTMLGPLEPMRFLAHPGTSRTGFAIADAEIRDQIRLASDGNCEQTVTSGSAKLNAVGVCLADFTRDNEPTRADLDSFITRAMGLNCRTHAWMASDILLQAAGRVPQRGKARHVFLKHAREALSIATRSIQKEMIFPALQRAAHGLKAMQTDTDEHNGHPQIDGFSDTLVVIYSCRKNLDTRLPFLRSTWIKALKSRSIPYVVLVGDGDDTIDGDVLQLDVADSYEALPQKTLKMIDWVHSQTDYQYLYKIDDDCYLSVEQFFNSLSYRKFHYYGRILHRGEGDTARTWHHAKAGGREARTRLDRSPEPSRYCDGSTGYSLSRYAMGKALDAAHGLKGRRLISSSYFEDKLLGDLLSLASITPSSEDYLAHILRRTADGQAPVAMYNNNFFPSKASPVSIVHLDDAESMPRVHHQAQQTVLAPPKIWPSHQEPRLGYNCNQLEYLSHSDKLARLRKAGIVLVAAIRNERSMLPHFLEHYRMLGVECFLMADNLSDDGTREYLLRQDDVALYSADSEYRDSHFGVDWQQAMLSNHCLGKWVVVVDADEFLTYPGVNNRPLQQVVAELDANGHDAARAILVDMYPKGPLARCNFANGRPFDLAAFHDDPAVIHQGGSGLFSNSPNQFTSALRHRLIPDAENSLFNATKYPLVRYTGLVHLSEGLHFVGNTRISSGDLFLAHFKYHSGFADRVDIEIKRAQHYESAHEYRKYHVMLKSTQGRLFREGVSRRLDPDLRPRFQHRSAATSVQGKKYADHHQEH